MNNIVVAMLDNVEGGIPLFGFGKLNAESMNKIVIDNFGLVVSLRVKGSGIFKLTTQKIP